MVDDEYEDSYVGAREQEIDEFLRTKPPIITPGYDQKYRSEPDIPEDQKKQMETYKPNYGRHVVFSNTSRHDNLRHLNAIELEMNWDKIPLFRHRATNKRVVEMSEFNMCRSNEPVGGFESQILATKIFKESAEVKNISDNGQKRSASFFERFRKNKKENQ